MMVMGSSNELGTCWRAYLWQQLHMNGITNFDFVGQQSGGPSCTVMGWNDTQLQAMSGNIITDITSATYLSWFQANPPDVILMHFGGADLLADKPIAGVMMSYQRALDAARMVKPKVILLIAQHTPEGKDTVPTLNADIAAWAPTVSTADSPVIAVDLYTGMLPADFVDGVHLNQQGSIKVADRWYKALAPFFGK
jgi:lysophospholipase L1-like esterase